jgi:alpha-L-fucosidase
MNMTNLFHSVFITIKFILSLMSFLKKIIIRSLIILGNLNSVFSQVSDIPSNPVVPSKQQIAWQEMEIIGFTHFTMNTFTDKEWGEGSEKEELFNPTDLDVEQWVQVAKEGGMKELILTAKHHDGFCLWPSKYTSHSIINSPWKGGKGDLVKEFTDACKKHGIKAGLYLSPWDRNHAEYGRPAYIEYYRNQITELLTNYGDISEFWFDGANGGTGYYGGANEKRSIDRHSYYDWANTWKLVKQLQPGILLFSDAGPDIRWIGNESGFAGETNWSMMSTDSIVPGEASAAYLNRGDPKGKQWIVGECDVSIRPGWFYHSQEDSLVKSPRQLVDLYYKSVGRNAVLLLIIPPSRQGLFARPDIMALIEFKRILDETFNTNLAQSAMVEASNIRLKNKKFQAENVVDNSKSSYWATDDSLRSGWIELKLSSTRSFDRIMLQEPIRFGQRVEEFEVQAFLNGEYKTLASGTSIGYKRLLRIPLVSTNRVRIIIKKANSCPAISNVGLYRASSRE